MPPSPHQYVDRRTGAIRDEKLYSDGLIRFLYDDAREQWPWLFRMLTGRRSTHLLGLLNYDLPLGSKLAGNTKFLRDLGVDLDECVDPPETLDTARKVFERRIRYWDCRPMPEDPQVVVSPADARALPGSFGPDSRLFLKEKFFVYEELLGADHRQWLACFDGGDYAIFRLTPDKYHYNHTPVAGEVLDIYAVEGAYHSCNPAAVVRLVNPYSKNRRVVTVIDTDVEGGTGVGRVAMIEIVAMMIGGIEQCYSSEAYDDPQPVRPGMFLNRGVPKSLYRPGSSTDVLIFEPGRIAFAEDLLRHRDAPAQSRFSEGFGASLVETDVELRSAIAGAADPAATHDRPTSVVHG